MSSIKQGGRRAIEVLEGACDEGGSIPPLCLNLDRHYDPAIKLNSSKGEFDKLIHVLGVSRGVGSATEKLGKNVLVLGEAPAISYPAFLYRYGAGKKIDDEDDGVRAAYAVLLLSRQPTSEEIGAAGIDSVCVPSCYCLERLKFISHRERKGWAVPVFEFSCTGKTAAFVAFA